jgi:hypothetical protein
MIQVDAKDADTLKGLNYKEESPELEAARQHEELLQNYYSSASQKASAALSGLGSTLTFGGSDYLNNVLSDDPEVDHQRASRNPGYRLAGELVGSVLPIGAPGLIGKIGGGLTAGVESTVARLGARGAVEGSLFGLGSEIANHQISGDPLTAESIMAGMGWGAVWGGGLGALAGKVAGKAEGERKAIQEALESESKLKALGEEKYGALHSSISDFNKTVDEATKVSQEQIKSFLATELKGTKDKLYNQIVNNTSVEMGLTKNSRSTLRGIEKDYGVAITAAKEGDAERVQSALEKMKEKAEAVRGFIGKNGANISDVGANLITSQAQKAIGAAKEMADLTTLSTALKDFPKSIEEFSSMTAKKMEKLSAAIDSATKGGVGGAEMAGIRDSINSSIADLVQHVGLTPAEGAKGTTIGGGLRELWQGLKGSTTRAGEGVAEDAAKGQVPWWQRKSQTYMKRAVAYSVGGAAGNLARSAGARGFGSYLAYDAGKNLTLGLLNLKGAVLGHISDLVSKWGPTASKGIYKVGTRLEALKVRLDGTMDTQNKTRQDLMKARRDEILLAAPAVRDTLYKGIQPLSMFHEDLAASLHDTGVKQFQALIDKVPRDPGNSMIRMQSTWDPGPQKTEEFAQTYEVFQNPIGVAQSILKTGKVLPAQAKALQEFNPALWTELRGRMIEKMDSGFLDKMDFNTQINTQLLLDLPIHSAMKPKFIAAQMQMFTQRNQPLQSRPQIGAAGTNGGRPSESPRMTQAQRTSLGQ